jgi:hypothetical protein
MDKNWADMTADEKLEALRQDIKDIAGYINILATDVRELSARLNEVRASVDILHKKEV